MQLFAMKYSWAIYLGAAFLNISQIEVATLGSNSTAASRPFQYPGTMSFISRMS
jgi:hypothetical protein